MTNLETQHPWLLVGPWYRPGPAAANVSGNVPGNVSANVSANARASRPVLQKYADPSFIGTFLREPQKSLRYRLRDLAYRIAGEAGQRERGNVRKVFLDTHSRFYLVVCELYCDAAGLPTVDREQVCEAGLVVRRRRAEVPSAVRDTLVSAVATMSATRTQLERFDAIQTSRARRKAVRTGTARAAVTDAVARRRHKTRCGLVAAYRASRASLEGLAAEHGVSLSPQGWVAGEHPGQGAWVDVEETPDALREETFPLLPLIPDPAAEDHSGRNRTLYYAVLPTGSRDLDPHGDPRFDDRSLYEVRCYVRRHQLPCPKTAASGDCPGPLVWSTPTEGYRLASHFDLDGTSNRPVTIQLPDLEALETDARGLSLGEGVGVRMIAPANSSLEFQSTPGEIPKKGAGQRGALPQICSFALPLITIVANFVLRLFLPIVVFVFGLWFLLRLKFCILPSISFAGDIDLAVDLAGELGIDGKFDLDLDVTFDPLVDQFIQSLIDDPSTTVNREMLEGMKDDVGFPDKAQFLIDQASDFSADAPADLDLGDSANPALARPLPPVGGEVLAYYPVLPMPQRGREVTA